MKRSVHGALWATSLCLIVSAVSFAWAQTETDRVHVVAGHDPLRPTEAPDEIANRTKFRRGLVSFLRYEKDLVELCHALYYDGRVDDYLRIAESLSGFDSSCGSCRPFFKTIEQTCEKAAQQREKVNLKIFATATAIAENPVEEETPAPIVPTIEVPAAPERDPSNDALNIVSRIFTTMSEYEKDLPEAMIALNKFVAGLNSDAPGRSAAERAYFETLTTYMMSPLQEYLEHEAQNRQLHEHDGPGGKKKNVEESGENVDAMFE